MKKIIVLFGLIFFNLSPAFAVDKYTIVGDNYSYQTSVYKKGEKIDVGSKVYESAFDIKKSYLNAFDTAAKKWATVLSSPEGSEPAGYAIFTEDEYNASAISPGIAIKESPYLVTAINAMINKKEPVDDDDDDDDEGDIPDDVHGFIFIGHGVDEDYPGWQEYSGLHSLYHGYSLPDLHTVLLHEIMHSLGISTEASACREGDKKYYFAEKDDGSLGIFDKDLRIYTGTDPTEFDSDYEIVPTAAMAVGKGLDFDMFAYSPYYVGETTVKVLSGKDDYKEARIAIIENGGFANYSVSYENEETLPRVWGMPIHNADDDEIDLSHLELRNSFMSHQYFRNWLVPMEAELAVLKDIGYDIDLRRFFGKSYYLSNLTENFDTGYSEWDGSAYTGNPSTVAQGVGLHVYGDNNKITQTSNISTVGEGSFGVRIDGVNNKYSLLSGSKIETNGKENFGIAVTWGKNHVINVENGSSVTATGEKGIAVGFDFGDNMFGHKSDIRGSYTNYSSDSQRNNIPRDEYDEALVKKFNLAGTITGSGAAIYIGETAHVAEINILKGAEINGDILSDWNSAEIGDNAKVQKRDDQRWSGWSPVDATDEAQIYFTDINIAQDFSGIINGSIDGETEGNNTLRLNNAGNTGISGKSIAVYSLKNSGIIEVESADIAVQNGFIGGNGELNVATDLHLAAEIERIDNTVNLGQDAMFSTINNAVETLDIAQLNANDAYISFELGDKYNLQKASSKNSAAISQIILPVKNADKLNDNATYELFGSADKVLDLGTSYGNVYYDGKKYRVMQDAEKKNLLRVKQAGENKFLPDAAQDETTASYIVTEDKENEDIGVVHGKSFEVSGKDVDVNGYKGMVVDGRLNKSTTLKTGIFGAKDSDIKVISDGKLKVVAQDKDITLGRQDEVALYLKNATAELNAQKHKITVDGAINGLEGGENLLKVAGKSVSFNEMENVDVVLQKAVAEMNAGVRNTSWEINSGELKVADDEFLAADGSNRIVANGGALNLINDKASDINLSKMDLNGGLTANIDIDLSSLSADRLVFFADEDITVNGGSLNIGEINLLNGETALTDAEIEIAFVDEAAHNQNLLGKVKMPVFAALTPVFKYDIGYGEDENSGSFVLKRGAESEYASYNPAVTVAPVASLAGGYLIQLHSYDEAFRDARENSQTAEYIGQTTVLPDKTVWIKPSSLFEKVGLKDGPKVRDNMYNLYAGVDSKGTKLAGNWDLQYGVYGGYNYSRQKYSGNTIHQKGGTLGVVARVRKNDLFSALTVNAGVDRADASTMYGKEHFYVFRYGIADKTGYNWRPYRDNFVVQPNLLMSYTSVDASNYHNAARVGIKSRPLHAFNIAPGLSLSYAAENGWQPYAEAKVVWSVMNGTKFEAARVDLPEMSVKPYVQYGVGLQKTAGERLSGYGEVNLLSGGRDGVEFTAGIRWLFE